MRPNRAYLYWAMAMASLKADALKELRSPNPDPKEEYLKRIKEKGVKEFEINGKIYLARNFKNAMRKAMNETK